MKFLRTIMIIVPLLFVAIFAYGVDEGEDIVFPTDGIWFNNANVAFDLQNGVDGEVAFGPGMIVSGSHLEVLGANWSTIAGNTTLTGGRVNITGGNVSFGSILKLTNVNGSLDGSVTESSGTIFIKNSQMSVVGGTLAFTNNTAFQGGAIYLVSDDMYNSILSLENTSFENNTAISSGGALYLVGHDYNDIEIEGSNGYVFASIIAKDKDVIFDGNKAFNGEIVNDVYMDNYSYMFLDAQENRQIIMNGGIRGKETDSSIGLQATIEKVGLGEFILGGSTDYDGFIQVKEGTFKFVADEAFMGGIEIGTQAKLSMENNGINKIFVGDAFIYGEIVMEVSFDLIESNILADTIEALAQNAVDTGTITLGEESKLYISNLSATTLEDLLGLNTEIRIKLMQASGGITGIFSESYYLDILMDDLSYGFTIEHNTNDIYLVIKAPTKPGPPEEGDGGNEGEPSVPDNPNNAGDGGGTEYPIFLLSRENPIVESLKPSTKKAVFLFETISKSSETYGYSPEINDLLMAINDFVGVTDEHEFIPNTPRAANPNNIPSAAAIEKVFAKLQGRSITNMLIMGAQESEGKIDSLYSKIDKKKDVWAQAYYGNMKYDSADNLLGEFKTDGYGINAGIELIANEGITGGLYADYGINKIKQGDDSGDMTDIVLGLYGGWFTKSVNVKANLSGAKQNFTSVRNIRISDSYGQIPEAEFDTYSIRFGSQVEYKIEVSRSINVKPFVRLHGGYVLNKDISEKNGAGTDLFIKANDYLKLISVLGIGLESDDSNSLIWNFNVHVGYTLVGDKPEYKVALANAPKAGDISDGGNQQTNLVGGASVGIGYTITETITIYTDLSADFGNDLFGYFATAGMKYKIGNVSAKKPTYKKAALGKQINTAESSNNDNANQSVLIEVPTLSIDGKAITDTITMDTDLSASLGSSLFGNLVNIEK